MLRLAWRAARASAVAAKALPLRAAVALGSAGLGEPLRPAQLWKAAAMIIPTALVTWWAIPQLTWVVSPSVEAWAVRAAPGAIGQGDYVSFWLTTPLAGPKPVRVTKHVLCLPGHMLIEIERPSRDPAGGRDGWYYCDGRLLGISKPFGRRGQPLVHFGWGRRALPRGFVYVGSRHPDGYDSRYYGPVAIGRLTRMERVL